MNDAGKKAILILDDDDDMVEGMSMVLECPEREIKAYTDPIRALADLNTMHIDLVIVDLCMPDISGEAFIKAARLRCPSIKVLVVSGRTGIDIAEFALFKPFDVRELMTAVDGLLA